MKTRDGGGSASALAAVRRCWEAGVDPAGDGATCSECGTRHRCRALISLARGAGARLPSSDPGGRLYLWVRVRQSGCRKSFTCLIYQSGFAPGAGVKHMFPWRTRSEYREEKLSKRLCACIITCLPASCFRCCSGHSICQPQLVGSEMCHKGALMDEAEHGANDAPTRPSNEGPHAGNKHL